MTETQSECPRCGAKHAWCDPSDPCGTERVVVFWHDESGRQVYRELAFDDEMVDRAIRAWNDWPVDLPITASWRRESSWRAMRRALTAALSEDRSSAAPPAGAAAIAPRERSPE